MSWPPPPAVDALDVLRVDVGELELMATPWQAAGLCAAALAKALGARAVLIHAHDAPASEIRAIGVNGHKAHNLLGSVEPVDDDFVASTVVSYGEPLTMQLGGQVPRLAPSRLRVVGAAASLVAVPVMAAGYCIGMIEIVDARENAERVTAGARVVADRLAEFLCAREAAA